MSRTGRPLAPGTPTRWLVVALLGISLSPAVALAAPAKEGKKTICCRASGGTRGTCLNVWAHLLPPSNTLHPGANRSIALLQGSSPEPAAMTLQFFSRDGDLVAEQSLPPRDVGVWLLTLPEAGRAGLGPDVVWESFPSCRPNKPPTRSQLVLAGPAEPGPAEQALAQLRRNCGGVVETAPLLRAFAMEETAAKLPPQLPVRCAALSLGSPVAPTAPERGAAP